MKNLLKLLGIIALFALIGFSFAACDNGGGGGGAEQSIKQNGKHI
jgi:predicted small secreted protein